MRTRNLAYPPSKALDVMIEHLRGWAEKSLDAAHAVSESQGEDASEQDLDQNQPTADPSSPQE